MMPLPYVPPTHADFLMSVLQVFEKYRVLKVRALPATFRLCTYS